MFEIIKDRMEIAVSKRTEKHGDDNVAAYDAKLTGDFPNAVLIKLDERLRGVFYGPGQQGDVEQDYFPELLFPLMGPVSWGLEMSRMVLCLHDIDAQENDLILTGKEIDKIKFSMKPGGTVKLGLRVKLGVMDDEDNLLKLLRAANQQLLVSLHQAEIEEPGDNFDQAERITQEPHSEARKEAENLFNAPPAVTPETVVLAESWTNPPEVEKKAKPRKAPVPSLEVAPE